MKSNYKRLGNYIQEVKVKNADLQARSLLGINIDKFFMPSVANVIGTDMATYRIVKKNQFACNRMHVGRDYRIPIALSKNEEPFMVSPAYDVFEIIDTAVLAPEYLMMWFSRKEFDRNAWFYTDADVRGGLPWKSFCDIQLTVPSFIKQNEIVKEYDTIINRIKLNEQLCKNLEETAQVIYKQWFVDFEFPDTNGKPYKSSGGEMIESEYGEVPKTWAYQKIGSYVKLNQGFVMNATTTHLVKSTGLPLLRITDLINDTTQYFIDENVDKKNIANKEDIIITRTGQVGLVFRNKIGVIYNNCFKITPDKNFIHKEYLFQFLKMPNTFNAMVELASGSSAQFDLTHTSFNTLPIVIPNIEVQNLFSKIVIPVENHKEIVYQENKKLEKLKTLLLSKLATIEN